jgi:hypothetical protein
MSSSLIRETVVRGLRIGKWRGGPSETEERPLTAKTDRSLGIALGWRSLGCYSPKPRPQLKSADEPAWPDTRHSTPRFRLIRMIERSSSGPR